MAKTLSLWERVYEGMYGKKRLASIADGYERFPNTSIPILRLDDELVYNNA
jgi:hypothetical protein